MTICEVWSALLPPHGRNGTHGVCRNDGTRKDLSVIGAYRKQRILAQRGCSGGEALKKCITCMTVVIQGAARTWMAIAIHVWLRTLSQTVRNMEGPVTMDDFEILAGPGQIFMLCQWLHSQVVYLLALQQATAEERAEFRQNPRYEGSIMNRQMDLQKDSLGPVIKEFICAFGDELTPDDRRRLDEFKFTRNSLAHCFFSLRHLEDERGFVSYSPGYQQEDEIRIWKLFTDETTAQSHIAEFLALGHCLQRLCQKMDIDYGRIL